MEKAFLSGILSDSAVRMMIVSLSNYYWKVEKNAFESAKSGYLENEKRYGQTENGSVSGGVENPKYFSNSSKGGKTDFW